MLFWPVLKLVTLSHKGLKEKNSESTNNNTFQPDRQHQIKTNMAATAGDPKAEPAEDPTFPVMKAGHRASDSDSMNNTSEYVTDKDDNCVLCKLLQRRTTVPNASGVASGSTVSARG